MAERGVLSAQTTSCRTAAGALGLAWRQPYRGSEQGWQPPSPRKGDERHQPRSSHQDAGAVVATTGTADGLAGGETGKPLIPLTIGQAAATTFSALPVTVTADLSAALTTATTAPAAGPLAKAQNS